MSARDADAICYPKSLGVVSHCRRRDWGSEFIPLALLCLLCISVGVSSIGCGGGSRSTPPNVTITIDPSVVTLGLRGAHQFKTTISGSTNANVTWEVNGINGGNSTVGTISSTGLYTAPAAVPNPPTVTVTAVSQANTADIANAAVTLTSDVLVSVSPASTDLQFGQTQQFTAKITGSTNNAVTWHAGGATGGNSTAGTISSAGLYTAPNSASGPLPTAISITAVSQVDTTKSGSASVVLHSALRVAVSPNPASVETYGSQLFTATVSGSSNSAVTWKVNGVVGGSSYTGTVSTAGLYRAPHSVPTKTNNGSSQATSVVVSAVSQADSSAVGSVVVTIVAPNQKLQNLPTPLGVSGGNSGDSSVSGTPTLCCGGTIGALVARGGNQYILGNSHVFARADDASIGESIVQPSLVDVGCSAGAATTVASLSQFVNLENPASGTPLVDAALARIAAGRVNPLGTILELGGNTNGNLPTDGPPHGGRGVTPSAALGSVHNGLVAKSGRSTGLTCSSIAAINVTAAIQYQKGCGAGVAFTATFNDLVDIHDGTFSAEGDSGSLIVTQDTADPVALLIASSDTDTLGNSISDVLSALADRTTGEQPLFVGTVSPHPVAACSLPGPQAAAAARLALPTVTPTQEKLQRATSTRNLHASELLSYPAVEVLGVGASLDDPGEAAILLFVKPGLEHGALPLHVDGVRTRLIEEENSPERAVLSVAESTALEESARPASNITALSDSELARARAVQAKHIDALMASPGVQGVGITSSADSPGEAALMIFLLRSVPHEPVPPVVDGLRTRILESGRFRSGAGFGDKTLGKCEPHIAVISPSANLGSDMR
jgi:hypothetical protein